MIDFDKLVVGPCMGTFGEPVLFQPKNGQPVSITAIFQERQLVTRFSGGDEVQDEKTILGVQASQFPNATPEQGDILIIRNRLWQVRDALADGVGHIDLEISLADDNQANLTPSQPTYS